ncbi:MAG TPA: WS/DGAT domain-containing protein, partial [Solirubrobacteraceae bacterium]|nr:WS/DGAT domain-containing protein [Solirubrobacteraceae bacterium]
LASTPLDREKPLWEMYLVDGPGVGSAVIVRMHHCIADGIALAEVMLSLTDAAPGGRREEASGEGDDERDGRDGERDQENGGVCAHAGAHARAYTRARTPRRNAIQTLALAPLTATRRTVAALTAPPASALAATGRATRALTREGLRTAAHPAHALELADSLAADTRSLAKLLFTPSEQRGALKGGLGVARTVAWSKPLDLARIKAIAHAQGATVNDVLLACVSGALRDYLSGRGEQPHGVQTMIPVNLRPLDEPVSPELGNRFGLVFLTLPVDRAGRRERLEELRRRMQAIKRSPEAPVSYAVLEAAGLTPPNVESLIVDVFTAKAAAVMTNVPGPRRTVYLAGSPLRSVLVWAPTAGSVGMSVSIFSYAGEVTIGLMVHTHLVPDPQRILNRLPRELSLIGRLSPAQGAAN